MKSVVINIDRLIDSIHYELTDVDVQNQQVEAQIHGFLSSALEAVSKSVADCSYNLPVSDDTGCSCPGVQITNSHHVENQEQTLLPCVSMPRVTVNIQCLVGTLKVTKP